MCPDFSSALPGNPRILVRSVNWLGDAVLTLPALERIRECLPSSPITILTHQKLASLWSLWRGADSVLTFASGESPFLVGWRLRPGGFDTALVLPNSPRSALEVWWASIPRRVGYARPWRNWLLSEAIGPRPGRVSMRKRSSAEVKSLVRSGAGPVPATPSPGVARTNSHQMHEYLFLAAALGADPQPIAPRLEIEAREVETAQVQLVAQVGQTLGPAALSAAPVFLGINPSAAYGPAKCWPAEHFAAAAREISKRLKDVVWLAFGAAGAKPLCAEIAAQAGVPCLNLAGKTTLRELAGYLAVCQVLLTNDSGPMHLGAALGTPVVVPFGSTSPELTGPGLPGDSRHRLLSCKAPCSPCFRRTCPIDLRCLVRIRVEEVVEAVLECLNSHRRAS